MNELICAIHGHYVLGPTGETTTCLRCGKPLDGLGLDPTFAPAAEAVDHE